MKYGGTFDNRKGIYGNEYGSSRSLKVKKVERGNGTYHAPTKHIDVKHNFQKKK